MRTLKDVPVGDRVRVVSVNGSGAVRRRIMDMGITKGVEIKVRGLAPLGDPVQLLVRGFTLALRRDDAKMVEVGGSVR